MTQNVLAPLDQWKLDRLKERFGQMSADEALNAAIETEVTMKSVGPFDPTFQFYVQRRDDYFKYAVLLEKQEPSSQPSEGTAP